MALKLPAKFLTDLDGVYGSLAPARFSRDFVSDLRLVYDALPGTSNDNLAFLSERLRQWRRATEESVRIRLQALTDDDPLYCPISLFRTMDAGRLEVAHTRTLAFLLDPRCEHGFGTSLVGALLSHVAGKACLHDLQVQEVRTECPIDHSGARGRLDILVEGTWNEPNSEGWVLLIEAKVDASEGEDQLQKYERWLKSKLRGRDDFRVFLTGDAREALTGDDEWKSMSFLELVQVFRTAYGGLRNAPGFHFLRLYLAGVLQDVCGFGCNLRNETVDPYRMAAYLNSVSDSRVEDTKR